MVPLREEWGRRRTTLEGVRRQGRETKACQERFQKDARFDGIGTRMTQRIESIAGSPGPPLS
jgi:hypothetical protein